jgi:hypothetical protein
MGACRLPAGLAVGLALALGLTACGGDNDPSAEPPTTAPPDPADTRPSSAAESKFPADFVQQVDPICKKAQTQVDKLVATEVRDPERLKELANVYRDTATELEGLEAPEQNRVAYGRFTSAFRDGEDLFERLEEEVGRGDSSAYQRVTSTLDEINTDVESLATDYGFQECASG